jgi:hypothetical protein
LTIGGLGADFVRLPPFFDMCQLSVSGGVQGYGDGGGLEVIEVAT